MQPKHILMKSSTVGDNGADPVIITRTRPPSSFCILPNTNMSQNVDCVTVPLKEKVNYKKLSKAEN